MKILHSADWHLDAPMTGFSEGQTALLHRELLDIPGKIASLCRSEACDLLILSGDLFDGKHTQQSLHMLRNALEEVAVPVIITPGNHDFCTTDSPWLTENWPENVHIFTRPALEILELPELDCTIYGAGYTAMDCAALLSGLQKKSGTRWHIGVLHGDPTSVSSPYCPITAQQVKDSGLDYLALGHIHKTGSFRSGDTLCAWPGCPMGKGYDETGEKGVLLVECGQGVTAEFRPLDTPRFYDEQIDAGEDAAAAVRNALPPIATDDFYRLTLTGYAPPVDLAAILAEYPGRNLTLRDITLPEMDLWGSVDDDTLEGVYFRLLHDGLDTDSEVLRRRIRLAAKISRQILDGQEVKLP